MNEISVKTANEEIQVSIDDVAFVFKKIKAGTFTMGAPHFRHDTFPSHNMTISYDYSVQETLLTQQQWCILKGKPIEEMLAASEFSELNGIGDDYQFYPLRWHEAKQVIGGQADVTSGWGLSAGSSRERSGWHWQVHTIRKPWSCSPLRRLRPSRRSFNSLSWFRNSRWLPSSQSGRRRTFGSGRHVDRVQVNGSTVHI